MSSPAEWYKSLPPVSRAFGTACFATTVLVQIGLVTPLMLYLDSALVFKQFQIWRLLTNFVFVGKFGMHFVMMLMMIVQYSVRLEKEIFHNRTADFIYMLMVGMALMLVAAIVLPFQLYFLSNSLIFMLIYLWARYFPDVNVSLWGLFSVKAIYLPWAFMAMGLLFGASPVPDLMGIIVGHVYYFLTRIYPRTGGRHLLITPGWLYSLVSRLGIGASQPGFVPHGAFSTQAPRHQPQAAAQGWGAAGGQRVAQQQEPVGGYRAFQGRGYRLGGE